MAKNKSAAWDIFNDKSHILPPPTQYLSFGDLKQIPEFRIALMRQDAEEFKRILYENGLDIEKGYNVSKSLHRMRTSNQLYNGFRVDSTERTDKEWIASGAASLEAIQHSSKDRSLVAELKNLDPRSYRDEDEDVECTVNLEFYD